MQVTPPASMQYFFIEVEPPQQGVESQQTQRAAAEPEAGQAASDEDYGGSSDADQDSAQDHSTPSAGPRLDVFA